MKYLEKINKSANYIKDIIKNKPEIGIILGSGLGGLGELIEEATVIEYENIPSFPKSTVEGHEGRLVFGKLGGKNVVAMQGRFHYYEGYPIEDVTFPVRVLSEIGISKLIVTNAAGGANEEYEPGDLMIISDHINFTGVNPLIGENLDEKGPRFPDMSQAYSKNLIKIAKDSSKELDIDLKEGVYMWFTGPTYETPAEVKLAQTLGGDALGMSTAPEVIVANHEGIEVLGISCITNMASGILPEPLRHDEVVETSLRVKDKFEGLVVRILENL